MADTGSHHRKDFDGWNRLKKSLHERSDVDRLFFQEREIWWCRLGVNIGSEQDGVGEDFSRPVVVVRKFNLDISLVVPLTSRSKEGRFYFSIGEVEGEPATAIISQIRLIDKRRFDEKIGTLKADAFNALVKAIVQADFETSRKSSPPQKRGRGRSRL